ncbi:hypothetical protein SAMN05720470_1255 [Fibrobacter sp. UWOV1]|nr:hypothetical protein SAMN05720470_1255 [Fibrobacter sp. UWOV1]
MQEGGLNLAKVCVILAGNHKHLTKDGMSWE